jgi:1,4-alpha-glucan branching enzyme
MPASQQHVTERTPMGATLIPTGGATFRVWAPAAHSVHVVTSGLPTATTPATWTANDADLLVRQTDDTWTGFVPGIGDGSPYRFWVVGDADAGFKRDPYARELGTDPAFPDCDCLVRDPASYPWHDAGYRPPEFRDLVIYQFHVGAFWAVNAQGNDVRNTRPAKYLDLLGRIEYLHDIGVNAVQPLPIQEYPSEFSLGYNGTDYFSPETDHQVELDAELQGYLVEANRLLAAKGQSALTLEQLRPGPNQLKLFIDLCHLYGMAVLFDVVYNHAGGGFDPQSLYFMDRRRNTSNNDSLYFTDKGWAGGLIFAYWNSPVRQFLIDNALFFLDEYHVDGFRYDEVSVIDQYGGWRFCQDLTGTVRYAKPQAIQIAEYWTDSPWLAVTPTPGGMGFDAAWSDRLRDAVRGGIETASHGGDATVAMEAIADALKPPPNFPAAWRAVHCLENHDKVLAGRERRLPALADGSNARSWWARSRARAATALLLTAPGIPMLFMGQEILEDRNWSDNPQQAPGSLIQWDRLTTDHTTRDHLAFTRDLVQLRRWYPALRSEVVNPYHRRSDTRVLAFHRWLEGSGEDVVVVASLNDDTYWEYDLGFPQPGRWRELFNSDYYENQPNPQVAGNGGAIDVLGPGRDGFEWSAHVVVPANSVVVYARE